MEEYEETDLAWAYSMFGAAAMLTCCMWAKGVDYVLFYFADIRRRNRRREGEQRAEPGAALRFPWETGESPG